MVVVRQHRRTATRKRDSHVQPALQPLPHEAPRHRRQRRLDPDGRPPRPRWRRSRPPPRGWSRRTLRSTTSRICSWRRTTRSNVPILTLPEGSDGPIYDGPILTIPVVPDDDGPIFDDPILTIPIGPGRHDAARRDDASRRHDATRGRAPRSSHPRVRAPRRPRRRPVLPTWRRTSRSRRRPSTAQGWST